MKIVKSDPMLFSKQLQSIMDSRGFSYTSLSRASGVGKSLIFNWANGTKPRSIDNLVTLSKVLDVTIDELCKGTQENNKVFKVMISEI